MEAPNSRALFPQLELLPYSLADSQFLTFNDSRTKSLIWQPERIVVVVGRGSRIEREVNIEAVCADRVPVMQRPTGGCAVVLTPEMVVASFGIREDKQLLSSEYFRRFNELVIRALEAEGVKGLSHRGTSDIAIGDKKIAGTALYRNRERVMYHAVINVAGSTDLIERYLLPPPRMPDYRLNRSHSEFVSSLVREGHALEIVRFRTAVTSEFEVAVEAMPA